MEPQNDYSHGRPTHRYYSKCSVVSLTYIRTLVRDSMEQKTLFDHLLSEWLIVPSAEMMMSGPV